MTPRTRYSVSVDVCTLVNEASGVVKGAVRVTFRVEIPVLFTAITNGRNAGFDPSIYNGHQREVRAENVTARPVRVDWL